MKSYDIAIVGGGLAGSAAAIALAADGFAVAHFAPPGPEDRRTSALMEPSVDFLRAAGLVAEPAALAEPLRRIRIIDATRRLVRAPETLFSADEAGRKAFAWNFANAPLLAHFAEVGATLPGLTSFAVPAATFSRQDEGFVIAAEGAGPVSARLLVGADGKRSPVRAFAGIRAHERPFPEAALVADLDLARPLEGTSVEFHYENGPFTLVPAGGSRANLVWIDRREVLDAARRGDLAAEFAERSQRLFGAVTPMGPAVVFPLSMLSVRTAGTDGVALVGEAAHAFPPIGAQGLNLGLRDVADLVAAATRIDRSRPDWADAVSRTYAEKRAADLMRTGAGVETLFRSLVDDFLPVQAARAGGLWALKLVPGLKRAAMQAGMGRP